MAGLTGSIEKFLKELLMETEDGIVEIGRNDLANRFNCAPSQINYVLTTRFTPYEGYHIESRRGGSGYIKIMKVSLKEQPNITELIQEAVGDSITKNKCYQLINTLIEEDFLSAREGRLIMHGLEDTALSNVDTDKRNQVRADILRSILLVLLR